MTSSSTAVGSMRQERPTLRSEVEAEAQGRSRLTRVLGRVFAFREGALHRELAGGAWEREVAETLEAPPSSLNLADLTPTQLTNEDLEADCVRQAGVELGRCLTREDCGRIPASLAAP